MSCHFSIFDTNESNVLDISAVLWFCLRICCITFTPFFFYYVHWCLIFRCYSITTCTVDTILRSVSFVPWLVVPSSVSWLLSLHPPPLLHSVLISLSLTPLPLPLLASFPAFMPFVSSFICHTFPSAYHLVSYPASCSLARLCCVSCLWGRGSGCCILCCVSVGHILSLSRPCWREDGTAHIEVSSSDVNLIYTHCRVQPQHLCVHTGDIHTTNPPH